MLKKRPLPANGSSGEASCKVLYCVYFTYFALPLPKELTVPPPKRLPDYAQSLIGKVVLVVTVGDVAVDSCWSRACNASLYERCRVVDAVAGCSCPALCDRVVKPVCASDGHTYDSLCHLQ